MEVKVVLIFTRRKIDVSRNVMRYFIFDVMKNLKKNYLHVY